MFIIRTGVRAPRTLTGANRMKKIHYFITGMLFIIITFTVYHCGCEDSEKSAQARHVILFIGDGMSLECEIAASRYLFGTDTGLSFHGLEYQGNVTTWDVTTYNYYSSVKGSDPFNPATFNPLTGYDPIRGGKLPYPLEKPYYTEKLTAQNEYFLLQGRATDSASAATAISTGQKTDDGNIAWLPSDPPDGALTGIAQELKIKRGFATGIASTVPFNHATPAGFAAHNINRNNYSPDNKTTGYTGITIAEEIIQSTRPDVVITGGFNTTYITPALLDELKNMNEYIVVERTTGIDGSAGILAGADNAAVHGKKLFGLFGSNRGNFDFAEPSDTPGTPSFTLNSENPTTADMVEATLKVLSRNKNGFFAMFEQGDIDWSNHANDYRHMIGCLDGLHLAVQKAIEYINRPGDDITWQNTLLIVTADHCTGYLRLDEDKIPAKGDLPQQAGSEPYTYPDNELSYGTTGHTNEPVRIYAKGAGISFFKEREGAWYPGTRLIDNTDVFHAMRKATGLE